jgi:hypothetical protein
MKRAQYLAHLRGYFKSHGKENIVYFDESGFEKHAYRPHGRAPRGQKVYGDVSGNNRKDVNLILFMIHCMIICDTLFLKGVYYHALSQEISRRDG